MSKNARSWQHLWLLVSKDVNTKLCFSLSFASAFLIDGMHLRPNKEITVAKDVNGSDIEWALGAAMVEASTLLSPTPMLRSNYLTNLGVDVSIATSSTTGISLAMVLLVIIAAIMMSRQCIIKKRQAQLQMAALKD